MIDYFSFKGRISRSTYWGRNVFIFFMHLILSLVVIDLLNENKLDLMKILQLTIWFMSSWAFIATGVKRLHDIGLTGWLWLLSFIPFLGLPIFCIAIGFIKGNPGVNRYGDVPSNIKDANFLDKYEKGV